MKSLTMRINIKREKFEFPMTMETHIYIFIMPDYISNRDIEKLIQDNHATHHEGKRFLNSLNVGNGSIVLDPDTLRYDDYETNTSIYYELPFIKGKPSNGYHEKFAWAFILTNKSKKIKFITVGKEPKLEIVTLYPKIVEWEGRKCIKLDKRCNFHQSPSYINSDWCRDCDKYCFPYPRCYDCNMCR
jgi:hypothetical protein